MQAIALCLIAFGVLLRPNAVIAAPVLASYAIWPDASRLQADRARLCAGRLLFLRARSRRLLWSARCRTGKYPLHSILVFDLGGITHFSGDNAFPVQWSAEQTALLRGQVL